LPGSVDILVIQLPRALAHGQDQANIEGFSQMIWLKPLSLINPNPLAEASGNS
jgi:hypothetical protein